MDLPPPDHLILYRLGCLAHIHRTRYYIRDQARVVFLQHFNLLVRLDSMPHQDLGLLADVFNYFILFLGKDGRNHAHVTRNVRESVN